jgi:hypothetical protein
VPSPAIPEPARLIPDSLLPLTLSEREATTPRKRGVRLSDGWEIPREWIAWTLGERKAWQERDVIRVSLAFRDHWLGNGTAKADWFATWRNWIRRERDPPVAAINGKSIHDIRAATAAAMHGDSDGNRRQGTAIERDITAESKRVA